MHSQRKIHPQFPQGFPQACALFFSPFHRVSASYPQCPQDIHSFHPHYPPVWIILWITLPPLSRPGNFVAKTYKHTRSCMFARQNLLQLVTSCAATNMTENFRSLRKRNIPKKSHLHAANAGAIVSDSAHSPSVTMQRPSGSRVIPHSSSTSMPLRPLIEAANNRFSPAPSVQIRP